MDPEYLLLKNVKQIFSSLVKIVVKYKTETNKIINKI